MLMDTLRAIVNKQFQKKKIILLLEIEKTVITLIIFFLIKHLLKCY